MLVLSTVVSINMDRNIQFVHVYIVELLVFVLCSVFCFNYWFMVD